MKKRGHAVRYPPGGNVIGEIYNMLIIDGHADSRLLGKVLDACPTLEDKTNFMRALLLQPPTDQQREWIEAFGLAWRWTEIVSSARDVQEVIRAGYEGPSIHRDERTIN